MQPIRLKRILMQKKFYRNKIERKRLQKGEFEYNKENVFKGLRKPAKTVQSLGINVGSFNDFDK